MRKVIAAFTPVTATQGTTPYINISQDDDGTVFLTMRDHLNRTLVMPLKQADFAMLLRETTMAWAKMLRAGQASRDPNGMDVA